MNTATAETETPAEVEFYKAEIRRLKAEIERDLAASAESQRRIEALGASTRARLDRIKEFIKTHYPDAHVFS